MSQVLDPSPILQTAFGFWNAKVLLTAVELGVFDQLDRRRMTAGELHDALGFKSRATRDFLDSLVAMKFLSREGDGESAKYSNTLAGEIYLVAKSPRYIGGILAMLMYQVFVNVGMTIGIMPITGVPLPLMSYGGSSMLVSFVCLGLLQSIAVQGRVAAATKGGRGL